MSSETAVKFHQRLKVKQAYFKQGESSGPMIRARVAEADWQRLWIKVSLFWFEP